MDKNNQEQIEKLLNAYIDGELSSRNQMELKRLIDNDPQVGQRLAQLERQRLLLLNLPKEKAPEGLAGNIQAALERKVLLDEYSGRTETAAGTVHLFARKLMTVAASLLMVGLLGYVIYDIVQPAETGTSIVVNDDGGSKGVDIEAFDPFEDSSRNLSAAAAEAEPLVYEQFSATMVVMTTGDRLVNQLISQAIVANDLLDSAEIRRTSGLSEYSLYCPISAITDLGDSIRSIWARSSSIRVEFYDPSGRLCSTEIASGADFNRLFDADSLERVSDNLRYYALIRGGQDNPLARVISSDVDNTLQVARPVMTSAAGQKKQHSGPRVRLIIKVQSL